MITRMRLRNFKSWKDTGELVLAPLTGFFGTNSSGKSSILQVLLMLKQTVESPDRKRVLHTGDERTYVDLGTFFDLVHEHRTDVALDISLSWELLERLLIQDPEQRKMLYETEELTLATTVGAENGQVVVRDFEYTFGKHRFGMTRRPPDTDQGRVEYDLEHGDYDAKRTRGRGWPLPPPIKCYGFPDEAVGYYQNTGFLPEFVLAFENLFGRIAYLGPLREYPKRSYVWSGDRPVDVGRRGEHAVAALLAAQSEGLTSPRLVKVRRHHRPIGERIVGWMRDMDLVHSFSLKPIAKNRRDYEVLVRTAPGSPDVRITDIGFGVSQILPVLVLCYYVPEQSIILLEHPEIHLHPSVQADLADVLIDVVNERGVQVIVESHSEHLLRRLQRRIAERAIAPDKTALYFCDLERGSSKAEKLDLDIFGNIRNWPKGFFGDEMDDVLSRAKAAMRHREALAQ